MQSRKYQAVIRRPIPPLVVASKLTQMMWQFLHNKHESDG